jgi:hypothetical protein
MAEVAVHWCSSRSSRSRTCSWLERRRRLVRMNASPTGLCVLSEWCCVSGTRHASKESGRLELEGTATAGAGAGRVNVVGKLGKGWEGREIVEEVEALGSLSHLRKGRVILRNRLSSVYFRETRRKGPFPARSRV